MILSHFSFPFSGPATYIVRVIVDSKLSHEKDKWHNFGDLIVCQFIIFFNSAMC